MVTLSAYRKQGYGSKVIKHAIKLAEKMNCYKIMLLSNKERDGAYGFYTSLGFKPDTKTAFEIRFSG